MLVAASLPLISTIVLCQALCSYAKPIVIRDNLIRLPFAKQINITSPRQLVTHDRARAAAFLNRGHDNFAGERRQDVAAINSGTYYTATVNIGTPATSYALLIDTGSSNTFVGTNTPYRKTSSSVFTGNTESVSYGSGSWSGNEYLDTVSLSHKLTIKQQSLGVATTSDGFDGIDGILGLGPRDLTEDTIDGKETIATVTDNLFSQGTITNNVVSVYFEPSIEEVSMNGELSFGGVDETKFIGDINYAPITSTSPANKYWGVDQTITYGSDNAIILNSAAGIVDTGSTLILLATDAFEKYQALTGGVPDTDTGLLRINVDQFAKLKSLFFTIAGETYELVPDAQIWPRALNSEIGGSTSEIYLIVADLGSPSGSGLDFINGMSWLERFYTVHDTDNAQVGFARTVFTEAVINSVI